MTHKYRIGFTKVVATGNDFILLERHALGNIDTPALLAPLLCHRRTGIGADGLLILDCAAVPLALDMYNPDGTEDFCGNGVRAAALYAHVRRYAPETFMLRHGGRTIACHIHRNHRLVDTEMDRASYHPPEIPLLSAPLIDAVVYRGITNTISSPIIGSALNTGGTHIVIPAPRLPSDEDFVTISSCLERDPRFPRRTSIIWARECAPFHLQIRIWERGVGETLGCGTGGAAAAVDYLRRRREHGAVRVDSSGGFLSVVLAPQTDRITIRGSARIVFSGSIASRALLHRRAGFDS